MEVQTPVAAPTHRDRLLAGMAAAVAERGLQRTTVADVVRHARTSRRTFYEHFDDRDACYLALFDAAIDTQMAEVAAAVRPGAIGEQVDRVIAAWLSTVATAPDLSASFVRDLPALGERGAARQHAVLERFAGLLVALAQDREDVGPLSHDMALMVVAGLRELVQQAIERGRDVEQLRPVAARLIRAVIAG